MTGLVAIHQPNFFPWLGYFDKIRRADVFVMLDAVDYPRAGSGSMGSWTNRVQIMISGEARWITCPVRKLRLGEPILKAEIDDSQPWRRKFLASLAANYGKAPNYVSCMSMLEPLIRNTETNLVEFNLTVIRSVARQLGVATRFVRQSEVGYAGRATELLISLVKGVGGSAYLAGGGAGGYQEDWRFAECGVELVYQNYRPLPYRRPQPFVPGLSVLDYLMWDGRPLPEAFPERGQ